MKAEIYPGILTHTLEEYVAKLEIVEQSGSGWVHLDFADGQFVPNITVMPHEIMGINTKLKIEAHLMTYMPERYFSDLTVAGVSRVLLHREAYKSMEECAAGLKQASDYFSEVGLVINPDTEVESYNELPIQSIQCMAVHPGMSGQALLESVYESIGKIAGQSLDLVIAVDGGVNSENVQLLQKAGASRFVINSHLFATSNIQQNLQHFIQLVTPGGI
jgi:ribulose-phosphate 3-epimerase